jgi:dihydrofolate reductase
MHSNGNDQINQFLASIHYNRQHTKRKNNMKTILWATLTANGNYAQSSPEHPPKQEALNDFAAHARAAGNFIVGRHTFEGMQDSNRIAQAERADGGNPFGDLDIVVISQHVQEIPGVKLVASPQAALDYLQTKGHTTALLAGGTALHNAFLGQGLVDELIFNIAPVLEGKGYNLLLDTNHYQYRDVQLLDVKSSGGGVVQLHYAINRT